MSLREALIAELKFVINVRQKTKPVKVTQSQSTSNSSSSSSGGFMRASTARSIVGSFLRLDNLEKVDRDNISNSKNSLNLKIN